MAVLPVGTVTFLITDIEASTERWQHDEQEMSRALRVHDETLKALVAGHGGVLFKHTGDGICAAFSTVGEAAVTALEAQSSLDLPVRMGLHVGAVELRDDDYYGTTVNVTARVASLACAGQIVVSDAIAVMLGDADLVDLGVHQLRGVSTPLRLFQLGPGAFPALSDAGSQPGNVPVELDEFIGRGAQLDELVVAVREDRVTTLLGVGGSGKTRLAIEAAHRLAGRYRDGCWFVELSSAADDAGVSSAFAAGLGIRLGPVGDAHERIVSAMSSRQALVVVDNCEHVLDAAGRLIERIVRHCHGVNVLATSREPLMISGERLTSVGALSEAEAVELFLVRARDEAPERSIRRAVTRRRGLDLRAAGPYAIGDRVGRVAHPCVQHSGAGRNVGRTVPSPGWWTPRPGGTTPDDAHHPRLVLRAVRQPTSGSCSIRCRCSRHGSTCRLPEPSPPTRRSAAWTPSICSPGSLTGRWSSTTSGSTVRRATGCWRRCGPTGANI